MKPRGSVEIQAACRVLGRVARILRMKNRSYGNSAASPMRVFSRADRMEQLRVRIDDKLARISRGVARDQEDTIMDLIGYLAIYHAVSTRGDK